MASQGANANYSGKQLEDAVENILQKYELSYHSQAKFTDIYGNSRSKMDFYVEDFDLGIECKRQMGSGTADQKMPFVVKNLEKFPAKYGLIVLDGDHYKARIGIQEYLNSEKSDTFNWIFLDAFEDWLLEQTNRRTTTK
jgi:hypothetical protein